MKTLLRSIVVLFVFVPFLLYGQTVEKLYAKIEKKLKEDNTYLNLLEVSFAPVKADDVKPFQGIPKKDGSKYDFELIDGVEYQFIILPENIDFDQPVLLFVKKVTPPSSLGGQKFFQSVAAAQPKVEIALDFEDVQNLYFNHRKIYNKLLNKVKELMKEETPKSLLKIHVDKELHKSKGISAPDNLDYLNFQYANSPHMYPKEKKSVTSGGRFVRPGSRKAGSTTPFKVSYDLSRLTFFYEKYMQWDNNSISTELNFNNGLLNLLPFQSMTMSLGIRSLIFLSGAKRNLRKDFIIDAKIFGRFRVNTSSLVTGLPFMFSERPKLNVGSGVVADVKTTRAFGLPFLHFYFASGTENYDNPYVSFGKPDSSWAYFSFTQWFATMSFYWNTNQERNLRMRFDFGIGRYNVSKATYYKGVQTELVYNQFQPYFKLYVNFVPKGNQLFSAAFRLYDSILKFDFWLQLLKLKPNHVVRFTASYIAEPLFRKTRPWENAKSTMIGLNYRFGF